MKKRKEIPKETLKRLPLYLRCLNELILKGQTTLSSKDLATILPMNSAKIRKDLSYFGSFGKRGVGYELKSLIVNIREILNLDQTWRLALVGVGDIGSALLSYPGFNQGCFRIELAFDDDPDLIGSRVAGKKIRDSKDITPLVKKFETQIGIIAVPAETARDIADRLVRGGVTGIINFAPVVLNHEEEIKCTQIDIETELSKLTYYIGETQT